MKVSVTDRGGFLRCRRAWYHLSTCGLALDSNRPPAIALSLGTAVHAGLGANADGKPWREAVLEDLRRNREESHEAYHKKVGVPMSKEEDLVLTDSEKMAVALLEHYFEHYTEERPLGPEFRYIRSEITFEIPVVTANGVEHVLAGTFDGLAVHEPTGEIWLVEHKTYSAKPSEEALGYDDQLTGYAWATKMLFGVQVRGALYDGLMKKLPIKPRELLNGNTSKEWIDTTAKLYRATLAERGQDEKDYADILGRLDLRDREPQNPFFTRFKVYIPQHSVEVWGQNLPREMLDMQAVVDSKGELAYPNRPWSGCWDCDMQDLCKAIQFGDDVDAIIRNNYHHNPHGHRTYHNDVVIRPGSNPLEV